MITARQHFVFTASPAVAVFFFTIILSVHHNAVVDSSTVSSCGPKFPDACTCGSTYYDGVIRYVVNCTNVGFHNTSVLEFLPEETQVLIFTGNQIKELPWNVFGAINDYENLEIVDMSNNHIHDIRGKSYHHVQNVKRLILNHNNLSISSRYDSDDDDDDVNHHHPRVFSNFLNLQELHLTDAFMDNTSYELSEDLHDIFMNSNLTKLRKLHLEQNEISKFKDRNVFCDLPELSDLHLGDNSLQAINFNVRCLKKLRFLDLQRNKFENMKMSDLQLLNELELDTEHHLINNVHLVVDLSLNPFICDCKISALHLWMKSTPITVRNKENLMCYRNRTYPELIETIQIGKCTKSQDFNYNFIGLGLNLSHSKDNNNKNNDNNDDDDDDDDDDVQSAAATTDARTITLVFLLTVLCFILFGLVTTLIYLSRDKIKYLITPVLDTVSKKVQYTTIKDEETPEVHL